ncbi:MAG: sensor histidine kinase, partial [Candidatus Electrothrix sp. ATG2]|nr:sensor histidine kinase [Candidatus Electrothrix sp. ATG2]
YVQGERVFLLNEEQGSFLLRIGGSEEVSALLLISCVSYPQYIQQYINAALAVSEVCSLAIEHVQTLKDLFNTSRLAGKAEVATEVLHNVGNTLNSISVSSEQIRETVQQSASAGFPGVVQLIQDHEGDLAHFLGHDSKGKMLPLYFAKLSEKLTEEGEFLLTESTRQLQHIRRVVEIIRAQQDEVKLAHFREQVNFTSLLEECLDFFQSDFEEQGIAVERHYGFQQDINGEPHKIIQVVNNLIRNAVEAFEGTSLAEKKISLNTYSIADQDEVAVEITDNGKGMQQEVLQQAFAFGYTTKKDGHGFDLHNAANLTAEMGGRLTGESAGSKQGASFKVRLPVTATGRKG